MKWAKAKTILICIFIVVNLFLFVVYKMNSSAGKKAEINNVITILKEYNITAEENDFYSLPKKMKQAEVKSLCAEETLILKLMGEYSESENKIITSGAKKYSYAGGIAEYSDSEPENPGFKKITRHNAAGKFTAYLNGLGIEEDSLNAERITNTGDGVIGAEIGYVFDGKELFGNRIIISANPKGVTSFNGPLCNISEIKNGIYVTLPCEAVLIDYLSFYGDKFKEPVSLQSVKGGYFVSRHAESVSSYAIPAYKYTFSDNKTVYIDARENIEAEFRLLQ